MNSRKWIDQTGRIRYQPRLPDGRGLVWSFGHHSWEQNEDELSGSPSLYRSKRMAERVALRTVRRMTQRFKLDG